VESFPPLKARMCNEARIIHTVVCNIPVKRSAKSHAYRLRVRRLSEKGRINGEYEKSLKFIASRREQLSPSNDG